MSPSKPTVSVIGVGRLGTALAIALHRAGYPLQSLIGRRRQQVRKAGASLDPPCEVLVAKELSKHQLGKLVIVAVPDDKIAQVAEGLAKTDFTKRRTILHTSGALSSAVLADLRRRGWGTGSIHPLASISDPTSGVAILQQAFWCVEGDAATVRLARRVVQDLGGRSFSIDRSDKPLYHAAAVMTSGHVTALFDVALEMLEKCGLTRKQAQKVLLPLLESAVENLIHFSPERALTGPFARGDVATIKLHLSKLGRANVPEALELYRLLGQRSLKLARNREVSDAVEELLR